MSVDAPNPNVYDLIEAPKAIALNFQRQLDLFQELSNYGSNLLVRCYVEKDRKLEDAVMLGCLMRQFLVNLDAVRVLMAQACIPAAALQLRAMLEQLFYLKWLLKEETVDRARCFYVWNLRQRRAWNRRTDPSTVEGRSFAELLKEDFPKVLENTQALKGEAAKQTAGIDRILAKPELAKVNARFDALRKNRPHDPAWHEPAGASSVRKVAIEVDMLVFYQSFYAKWSEATHSSGFYTNLYTDSSGTSIEQVRSLEGISDLLRMGGYFAVEFYRAILMHYRPGEEEAFNKKYIEEWRERYRNFPKIKIERRE